MQLKKNAHVYTADQQEAGRVKRVVIDPKTKQITHIVVEKGMLFTDERVLPIHMVADATEEQVTLQGAPGDLNELPKFEETNYVPMSSDIAGGGEPVVTSPGGSYAPSVYGYPPVSVGGGTADERYVKHIDQNIPEGTVAVKEGAKVITEDGHTAGKIKQVFFDSGTKQATHILISKGMLLKEQKLVPTFWIRLFGEDEVHLAAPANVLEKLQPYQN
jgi:uncharacterized protein YrrD